ncbi:MAG: AAA family ATPase [Bacteroidetes bacterium]|jgi:chromosome partitioning protein|nr:AAA family ATPase [Bacteroidota bacterium]
MRRVIFNQKGGVGKSSIAVNLAALSAERGHRTLLIDLDAQCNATQYVLDDAEVEATAADFFEQFLSFRLLTRNVEEFIVSTPFPNLDVLPAAPELRELESRLESKYKIYKLREALDALDDDAYEAVYIDTPPALNFYTLSALIAADTCLIPFDCDEFARHALYGLLDTVRELRADHNERLEVEGIVVNQFDVRANLPKRVVQELRAEELPVLDTLIPASVKMRESHERATPLVYFAPQHKLTQRLSDLYDELQAG